MGPRLNRLQETNGLVAEARNIALMVASCCIFSQWLFPTISGSGKLKQFRRYFYDNDSPAPRVPLQACRPFVAHGATSQCSQLKEIHAHKHRF